MSFAVDAGTLGGVEVAQVLDGRYELLDQLGRGGMAVVWRARDAVLGRSVAVKVLAGPHASDPLSRQRIYDEARAAAALSHPNIAAVHDFGEADDDGERIPYVVMELVPGRTLKQHMTAGPVPPKFAFKVCAEVAAALTAAHADGLVHRDIKPANVMVTPTGAKVVDFGIAAAIAPAGSGKPSDELIGTPAYLAPERLIGDGVQPASDVYALGVILYRLLAGHSPWNADTTTKMLAAHIYIEPDPLPALPDVPDYITGLCNRCLSKDPTQRPSAREAAAMLAHAAGIRVEDHDPAAVPVPLESGAPAASGARAIPLGGGPAEPAAAHTPPIEVTFTPPPPFRGAAGPVAGGPPPPSAGAARPSGAANAPAAGQTPADASAASPDAEPASGPPRRRRFALTLSAAAVVAVAALVTTFSAPGSFVLTGGKEQDSSAGKAQPTGPASVAAPPGSGGVVVVPPSADPIGSPAPSDASPSPVTPSGGSPSASGPPPWAKPPPPVHPDPEDTDSGGRGADDQDVGADDPVHPAPTSRPPRASPTPTATRTAPPKKPPAPQVRTLSSFAGSVRATCRPNGLAEILSTDPKRGYEVEDINAGPSRAPEVEFELGLYSVHMTITCSGGVPSANIDSGWV